MSDTTTNDAPPVIHRYLQASDTREVEEIAACFTDDAIVFDEGKTYRGRDEIIRWREGTVSKWTYTTTVTGSQSVSATEYLVMAHVAGNFPGGEADLTFRFELQDGLIAVLDIG